MGEKTYRKAAYNSRMGLPIMSQEPGKNEQLVATILLPEEEAQRVGDAILDTLRSTPKAANGDTGQFCDWAMTHRRHWFMDSGKLREQYRLEHDQAQDIFVAGRASVQDGPADPDAEPEDRCKHCGQIYDAHSSLRSGAKCPIGDNGWEEADVAVQDGPADQKEESCANTAEKSGTCAPRAAAALTAETAIAERTNKSERTSVTPADSGDNQVKRLTEAINWACGCGDGFEPPEGPGMVPRYWWRAGLTERAGLTYDGTRYVLKTTASPELPAIEDTYGMGAVPVAEALRQREAQLREALAKLRALKHQALPNEEDWAKANRMVAEKDHGGSRAYGWAREFCRERQLREALRALTEHQAPNYPPEEK